MKYYHWKHITLQREIKESINLWNNKPYLLIDRFISVKMHIIPKYIYRSKTVIFKLSIWIKKCFLIWRWDRWEQSPLPLNAIEAPNWSEEQSEQPTVFQHIWRSESKDRRHWNIWWWDNKTWSAEKSRVRPCYTHKHKLKTSEHKRLRRQHHWIPLAYHKPRESE